ncbi:MAG: acyltransferase, partial [Actinobacteria bacterium]|nr:acyltransferase [Actinomycetota bacterium]
GSAAWWAWRPLWVAALALALLPLVAVFARVELARVAARPQPAVRTALAAVAVVAGMGVLAKRGFVAPGAGLGLVTAGWWLLRGRARTASS